MQAIVSELWKRVIGILATAILLMITYFYVSILWKGRREPAIEARNISILCISVIATISNSILALLDLTFNSVECRLMMISKYSLLNLHVIPFALRGFQYVVLTNDQFRRKRIGKYLKSNTFMLKIVLCYSLLHETTCFIFLYTLNSYAGGNCYPSWDAWYLGISLLLVFILVGFISSKIPWSFDSFKIAQELKLCFLFWATLGVLALAADSSLNSTETRVGSKIADCLLISMNACTFYISIVWPLHTNTAVLRRRSKGKKNMKKGHKRQRTSLIEAYTQTPLQNQRKKLKKVRKQKKLTLLRFRVKQSSPKLQKGNFTTHSFSSEESSISHSYNFQQHPISLINVDEQRFAWGMRTEVVRSPKQASNHNGNTFLGYTCIEKIFSDPDATASAFLLANTHFMSETVLFLHSVFQFRTEFAAIEDPEVLYAEYVRIVIDFIEEKSPYEINISSKMRDEVMEFINDYTEFCFSLTNEERLSLFDVAVKETECIFWDQLVPQFCLDEVKSLK